MLKEYKFNKLEAINHIEAANGKKLMGFSTGTAYYTGQPRVHWQLEGEGPQWANPEMSGYCIDALFFPGKEVVSRKIDICAETFEFVVREVDQDGQEEKAS